MLIWDVGVPSIGLTAAQNTCLLNSVISSFDFSQDHGTRLVSHTLLDAHSRKIYFILASELELEPSFPPVKSPSPSVIPHVLCMYSKLRCYLFI